MKPLVHKGVRLLLCLALFISSFSAFSQQTLTTINGWNAYVHLPDDYGSTGSKTYPMIVFFPGTGEVGTDASRLINYGPNHFIASGWNGYITVNGTTVKPIIVSLQPPAVYPQVPDVDKEIESLKSLYRVDPKRISLTGLSMGGWTAEMYVQAHPDKVASVVALQAVVPDDNPAYPAPFATYAKSWCGHWLGYEQVNDARDMLHIYNTMQAAVSGSATYFQTNVGGGGHCCWNTWYDPTHTDPYTLNGVSGNWTIYQYMMTWSGCTTGNIAPTVSAGNAQTITLPTNSITLNGTATGNSGATISSTSWTESAGGAATITSSTKLSTTITGLVAGSYTFKLSATDNHGLTSSSTVNVTVYAATSKTPPVVSAGSSQVITLPAGGSTQKTSSASLAATPTLSPAYFNCSQAVVNISGWANMHGSPGSAVVTASSNGITLSSVSTANWAPYNGMTSYDGNGVNAAGYFGNAQISVNNWFQYGDPTATFNSAKPQFQASGLTAGTSYTIKVSGSDNLGFDTNPVRYTVTGLSNYGSQDISLDYTASNGVTFNNVYPDASGKINIYVNAIPGSSQAAEVNGIQIIPNSSVAAPPPPAGTASVTLTGSAIGTNGASIVSTVWSQTSGAASAISSPNSLVTVVTGLVAGVYVYKLTATDNNGMSNSSAVTITVTSGTSASGGTNSIQVNLYGGQNPYSNAAWNNWDVTSAVSAPATSGAFKYADGTSSPVTATLSASQGIGDNGASYGGTIVAPEVLRYTTYFSGTRTLIIKNIPATSLATLEIYGSRSNTGNASIYTVNGVSNNLVTDYNLTNSVIFKNVTVSNGQVTINISKTSSFNYVNGFRLSFTATSTAAAGGGEPSMLTASDVTGDKLDDARARLLTYPNPFDNMFHIKWSNIYTGHATLAIYSLDGKMVMMRDIQKDQFDYEQNISFPAQSSGLYQLVIRLPDGKSFMQRILKR